MPRTLPRVVQNLITQTPDATRVRDTLSQALQPTLDFLNGYFQPAADGSMRLLARLVAKGATLNGDVSIAGNLAVTTRTANGVIIVPAGGTPAFYVTNAANTSALFVVNADGTCSAPSFTSASGFKCALDGGTYGNTNVTASTQYQHTIYTAVGTPNKVIPMPFAGSLVGVSGQYQGTSTQTVDITVNKNNALLWNLNGFLTSSSTSLAQYKMNKGAYTFAQGDFLTVLSRYNATGNVQMQITLWVELGA